MLTVSSIRTAPVAPVPRKARISILDSYIFNELAGPFLFSLSAFLLFWFLNIFFLAADYIINSHAPIFLVLRFVLLRVPQSIPMAFPFACLFATLLAFGRMAADNEIVALRTAGISFRRIAFAPLALGLAAFAFCYFVSDTVVPKSIAMSTRTFYQIVYHTQTLPILPQFFRKDDATGRVFYVGNVEPDHHTMENIMIFEPAVNSPFREVINAERGVIEGNSLILKDARLVRFKRNGAMDAFEQTSSSQNIVIPLPLGENIEQFLNTAGNDPNMLDSHQLQTEIGSMQSSGQGGAALDLLKITLAQKLSFPFASFIAVMIALPLAVEFGKKGRSLGIALSIVVYFGYYLLMSASIALGKNGAVDPYVAAWMPNALFAFVGMLLFWRIEH
ncbi:MAG TPA: LptF/LptG family permease [Candidatus Baltobacteraceae bacterium]|jgi:lipopolysaccharide export system permease protein|nr:LptF/LptG family permease [Candidatus Baltobacteraceae bacterium]